MPTLVFVLNCNDLFWLERTDILIQKNRKLGQKKKSFVFKTTTHFHVCPPKQPSHNLSFSSSHCENTQKVSVVCLLHMF